LSHVWDKFLHTDDCYRKVSPDEDFRREVEMSITKYVILIVSRVINILSPYIYLRRKFSNMLVAKRPHRREMAPQNSSRAKVLPYVLPSAGSGADPGVNGDICGAAETAQWPSEVHCFPCIAVIV